MTEVRPALPGSNAELYRDPGDLALGGFVDRSTFRFVRNYPHPPGLVWSALTDARQLEVWLWPCTLFEGRLGGVAVFDPGRQLTLTITEYEPERVLNFGGRIRFQLAETREGCRLTLDLTRPSDGWSPMAMAGFHGWLGRLSRLLNGRPQDETEAWALGIWNSVIDHCEWEVSRWVANGDRAVWRVHFPENDATLSTEAKGLLDDLAQTLATRRVGVAIDGFGDDPCAVDDSVRLCAARMDAVCAYLQAAGVPKDGVSRGFVLGNYHYRVERSDAAGRAFNRRIELRPTY